MAAAPVYLVRLTEDRLRAFAEGEGLDALRRELRLYLTPHAAGCCADCGRAKLPSEDFYNSPESVGLLEVMLDGFKAVQAQPRVICRECYRLAFHRVSGDESICPL